MEQYILGHGSLTKAGRRRLLEWLKDVLLHPEQIREFAKEIEETLVLQLGEHEPYVADVPRSQVREGAPTEFRLQLGEYELPAPGIATDTCDPPSELPPLLWKAVSNHDKAIYAAAAAVLFECGGRFVAWGDNYRSLLEAVKASPLPPQFQQLLGPKAVNPWLRYSSDVVQSQGVFLALHAFCSTHLDNFELAWERPAQLLADDLSRLTWALTGEKPILRVDHPDYPVTPADVAAFQEGKRQFQLEAAGLHDDPSINGRPGEALLAPRPDLENDFTWWCLKLGSMMQSKFRDRADYTAVIDEIAERCMQCMPEAHQQARARRSDDRYGTTENDALPKYVRWLLQREQPDRAVLVCRFAIEHRISPKSAGAFTRELRHAEARLKGGNQKRRS